MERTRKYGWKPNTNKNIEKPKLIFSLWFQLDIKKLELIIFSLNLV
jgi:hypothetical protein